MYPIAALAAFLYLFAFLLSIFPLMWHIRLRNISSIAFIAWFSISNFSYFVNAIVWGHDDIQSWWSGHGYCDFFIHFNVAANIGVPGSIVCILRNLAILFNRNRVAAPVSAQAKRWNMVFDIIMCFGFPVVMMVLYYLVQPYRYYIFGISGCAWSYDPSWLSWVIVIMWPVLFTIVGTFYSALVLFRVFRYRREFPQLMAVSSMTKSRFIRLYLMGTIPILALVPVEALIFKYAFKFVYIPYSFSRVHADFATIPMFPSGGQLQWDRWIPPVALTISFFLFGFGKDAQEMYVEWIRKTGILKLVPASVRRRFGSKPAAGQGTKGVTGMSGPATRQNHRSKNRSAIDTFDLEAGGLDYKDSFWPGPDDSPSPLPASTEKSSINGVGQVMPSLEKNESFESHGDASPSQSSSASLPLSTTQPSHPAGLRVQTDVGQPSVNDGNNNNNSSNSNNKVSALSPAPTTPPQVHCQDEYHHDGEVLRIDRSVWNRVQTGIVDRIRRGSGDAATGAADQAGSR